MRIRKLSLINFQKHSDLQIDFVDGINILHGSSDVGKSCVRRALEWVCQNENIDGIRKTGTKKTSVCIVLDSNVEIERTRSSSINRYIIRKNGEETEFNAIGKTIPDEVKELLTIYPIEVDGEELYLNSQPQIALPFLFDKSPSFRHKLFNKLTGNDVLDALFGQFNKDILKIKRDKKRETEIFEERSEELKQKEIEKEKAEAIYSRLKKRVEKIKELYEKYCNLMEIKHLEEKYICDLQEVKHCLGKMNFPEVEVLQQLRVKISRFDTLNTLKMSTEKAQIALNKVRGQLREESALEVNLDNLRGKIDRYDTLKKTYLSLDNNKEACYTCKENIKGVKISLKDNIAKYKELLKEVKVCPVCKNSITDECLKEIK